VGDYFNRIQAAGSSPELADTVVKLLYDPTMEAYRESLSMLSPDFYGEQQAEFIRGSGRFGETLLDGGAFRYGQNGRLFWFDFQNADTSHSAYDDYKGARHQSTGFAMGIEQEFSNQWTFGLGFSLEDVDSSGYDGRWRADGYTERIGLVAKRRFGATEVGGILSYAWSQMESNRSGQVTTPYFTEVDRDLGALTAMVRVSHEFNRDGLYCKPMLDFGVTRLNANSAHEEGAGPTNLELGSYDETHLWIRPAFEFGKDLTLEAGTRLHMYANVAYNCFLSQSHTDVVAGFKGAPEGVSPMKVPIDLGNIVSASVGLDLILTNNVQLGVQYTKALDEEYDVDVVNLKVSTSF
jgi:hypothetical protein